MKLHELKTARTSLISLLRFFVIGSVAPFFILFIIVLFSLASFNSEYAVTLKNANTAGEINYDFKQNLDLHMYYFVIGNQKYSNALPIDEVERAEAVITKLQKTTTLSENKWRLNSMMNLCERLKEYMLEIEQTSGYDQRMEQLNNDIYLITNLIQKYMNEYIYDEVNSLYTLQQEINSRVILAVVVSAVSGAILLALLLVFSKKITRSIVNPINQLCKKVEMVGSGDFLMTPINTRNTEIQTLDDGFNEMARRIDILLERVKSDQYTLRKTEMELLQAQINPHFLYNTFDSIIWLAETHKYEQVVKMTTNLSTFFRNSLSKGKDIITLAIEKQQVESYLKIQQIRYCDILDYVIDIPSSLLEFTIPKLTLQPLVENALYHGVKNKRGGGKITITAAAQNGEIFISVHDNGAGMSAEQLESLKNGVYTDRHTGLGLVNVHKRLQLYYGECGGIDIESVLNEGTTVTVRLPKQNQLSE